MGGITTDSQAMMTPLTIFKVRDEFVPVQISIMRVSSLLMWLSPFLQSSTFIDTNGFYAYAPIGEYSSYLRAWTMTRDVCSFA